MTTDNFETLRKASLFAEQAIKDYFTGFISCNVEYSPDSETPTLNGAVLAISATEGKGINGMTSAIKSYSDFDEMSVYSGGGNFVKIYGLAEDEDFSEEFVSSVALDIIRLCCAVELELENVTEEKTVLELMGIPMLLPQKMLQIHLDGSELELRFLFEDRGLNIRYDYTISEFFEKAAGLCAYSQPELEELKKEFDAHTAKLDALNKQGYVPLENFTYFQ